MPLMQRISAIQKMERESQKRRNSPEKAVRISIVTARSAPAHERLLNTMKNLGIEADELFLSGGIAKKNILDVLKPQIFFDDQLGHLTPASVNTPCVHIPFGFRNQEREAPAPPAPRSTTAPAALPPAKARARGRPSRGRGR